jgi:hypothetical protein
MELSCALLSTMGILISLLCYFNTAVTLQVLLQLSTSLSSTITPHLMAILLNVA